MFRQTGNITYPTQNISQSNSQIHAQEHMPTGAGVQANQTIPLGIGGPYTQQSLQPMSNPKYDDIGQETIHAFTVHTLDETTRAKRVRDSETPDESKTKRKGQKMSYEEEAEEERGSARNEIKKLQEEMREEMRQIREEAREAREAREQGPFFKDHEKDMQSRQESEKQQQQQQQQNRLLIQQQMSGQQQQQRHQGQQQPDVQQQQNSQTFADVVHHNTGFPPLASNTNPQNPIGPQPQRQVTQSQLIERASKSISKIKLDTHDL
jgi:hypothetical protein